MPMFSGPEEEVRALKWMSNRLKEKRKSLTVKNSTQIESITDLLTQLNSREKELAVGEVSGEDEWHDDLWERFIFAYSDVQMSDADATWSPPFSEGEWEFTQATKLEIGYSDKLDYTYVPRGGGSAKHYYTSPPDCVEWELTPMAQKGHTFLIGKAKVSEIDAVSSVPQLPAEMEASETAMRVLDKKRGDNEWQRRVDPKRVISISKFISGADNIIANSAILFAPSHKSLTVDESTGKVKICFDEFLDDNKGSWCDHKGKRDLRPVWLIDGQHRTRGLAQSKVGSEIEIPIIFFPPSFDLSQSAKIFSEINTLQRKLTSLHTLYMQHRFSIPSPLGKRDFQLPFMDASGKVTNKNSRANHFSYECAAHLAAKKTGPLHNQIKILDQNSSRTTIITASSWVDFSRFWFGDGQIYGPHCVEDQNTINSEVENYFTAFINTCNHKDWKGTPRWPTGGRTKSLLQRHSPSQALLKIYPTVHRAARNNGAKTPITVGEFEKVLDPLKWVDWIDPKLVNTYNRAGERPRTMLRIWMISAITNGVSHSRSDVMSETEKSQLGKGILSSPGNGKMELVSSNQWPTRNKPVELLATQPHNTLPTSTWTIIDSNGVNRTGDNGSIVARNGSVILKLKHEDWMNDATSMDIRVDWHNLFSPPGFAQKSLKKT